MDIGDKAHDAYDAAKAGVNTARDKFRKTRGGIFSDLQNAGRSLPLFVFGTLILMAGVCVVVFFTFVKGPEEVMVPKVVGKVWSEALIQLQDKELYPKIQLRYTGNSADIDKILYQKPEAGSIVRGYSRVELTIGTGKSPAQLDEEAEGE